MPPAPENSRLRSFYVAYNSLALVCSVLLAVLLIPEHHWLWNVLSGFGVGVAAFRLLASWVLKKLHDAKPPDMQPIENRVSG